jgi:hypothetical protein
VPLHTNLQDLKFSQRWLWVTCSSETSGDVQRTTRTYIPEDRTLHTIGIEILQSTILKSTVFLNVISLFRREPDVSEEHISIFGSNNEPIKKPAEAGCKLLLVSFFSYSSTLNNKTICSSETSGSPKYMASQPRKRYCCYLFIVYLTMISVT